MFGDERSVCRTDHLPCRKDLGLMEQMNGRSGLSGGAIAWSSRSAAPGTYQHHAYQHDGAQRQHRVWSGATFDVCIEGLGRGIATVFERVLK